MRYFCLRKHDNSILIRMNMKEKADNTIIKRNGVVRTLIEKIGEGREWMRYHFSKDFLGLLKTVLKSYPWDEHYLYELERAKILEMCRYQERRRTFVGSEYTIRDMKICMSLIDIFNSNDTDLFHYTGEVKYIPIEGTDEIEVDSRDLVYHCDVYVNSRNAGRFLSEGQQESRHPHELYIEKARSLYHKIRLERDFEWWD